MNADNRLCGIAPYIDTTAPSLRRGTNRICAVCGEPVAHVNHAIFGGSPTFHGFVDSGRRAPVKRWTCPVCGDADPGCVLVTCEERAAIKRRVAAEGSPR